MDAIAITLDTDWAPDAAIDHAASILIAHGVKATWFITHASPAIDRLRARPALFEVGIHPNFLPGSSHGTSTAEVLDHCMKLAPEATSMRTHSLHQSTPIFDVVLSRTPVRVDASLFLPRAQHLAPVDYQWKGKSLLRVPYNWEDDVEMLRHVPSWELGPMLALPGLRIFDFHPIHVHLNSADMAPYEALKRAVPRLNEAGAADIAPHANPGVGSGTAFEALARTLARAGGGVRMRDIQAQWNAASA